MRKWRTQWPTLKRLLSYSAPYRKPLILAVAMLWLAAAAEVAGPVVISYFIDHVVPMKAFPPLLVTGLALAFVALQCTSASLRYYQALMFNRTALEVVQKLRTEVMDAALRQPLSTFDTQPVGQLISRVTNDTEVVKDLYITVMATVLRCIALVGAMLVAMFALDWRMACVSLTIFPVVVLVMSVYQIYSTPIVRRLRGYLADINNGFNEAIGGMSVIQQFRQQQRFGKKLADASHAHYVARMQTLRLESYLLRPLLSMLSALVLCGLLVLFGFSPVGSVGVGVLYAFINYLGRLNEPLIELTTQQSLLQQAVVAGERIFELMDGNQQCYGDDDRPLRSGRIDIKDLTFSYRDNMPVLRQVSMTAPSHSFIALVGHTGSGKSTLANLIMGYYPIAQGQLLIDGRPIDRLSHRVLRHGVAIVQQDPVVLADTVLANISLGRNITEAQVWQVLEQVQLADLVRDLPEGIYTELGEQGNTLSVGQKQLLALARVMVLTPKILILDEATANIDSGTEQAIQRALNVIRRHTTLVVIAHRLSTIVDAEEILVLHRGEAVERGSHESLLLQRGRYFQMYRLQQAGQALDAGLLPVIT
jgi:ABC-type multidrug transport system fused ATPase/permease subunit